MKLTILLLSAMKNLAILLIFLPFFVFSQKQKTENLLKLSISSLPFKAVTVHYERVLEKKMSIGIGVSYRPKSALKLPQFVQNVLTKYAEKEENFSFQNVSLPDMKMGDLSFTPEVRFYLSRTRAPEGFYLSLFLKANFYNIDLPTTFSFPYQGQDIVQQYPGTFKVNTYSGGLMLGYQKHLTNKLFVDLFLLGGYYGFTNMYSFTPEDLSFLLPEEKLLVKQRVFETYGVTDKQFAVRVMDTGVEMTQVGNIPAIGLRMFGVNLGYAF